MRIGALGYDVDGQLQTDCINCLRLYEHIFRSTSVESVTEEQLALQLIMVSLILLICGNVLRVVATICKKMIIFMSSPNRFFISSS